MQGMKRETEEIGTLEAGGRDEVGGERGYRMAHLPFCFLTGWGRGFRTALQGQDVSFTARHPSQEDHGGRNVPDGLVKDALKVALGEGGALEVLMGLDLLGAEEGLVVRHGIHALLAQGVERCGVFAEVELRPDEDDGDVGRVVVDLGVPLQGRASVSVTSLRGGPGRGRRAEERTLALTLSKDGGLTMEKQMRKTSVCG